MLYSIDLELSATNITSYYRQNFHLNTSLTTVNLARGGYARFSEPSSVADAKPQQPDDAAEGFLRLRR